MSVLGVVLWIVVALTFPVIVVGGFRFAWDKWSRTEGPTLAEQLLVILLPINMICLIVLWFVGPSFTIMRIRGA
ncbi:MULTISPECIES: hypothetical protein [Rhodococcus erythropolis group]|uniref:Uncharacterized protein n=1 Tax=Rhodococcus erythropolis TaxID=1833 RepID=A0A8I0ZVZ2_RHOER|nr:MULTISPECIES: hypothetical protein [Rhodococcus erythropolis group]MBH5144248.1 hypothetical protein [Rhodococcus erythropolis]MDJ0434704.1 hypothetical protein [Rhodococcus qingshengii]QEM25716.1 hypothetical protein D6M20_02420 [Rhodococcus qingshengii]